MQMFQPYATTYGMLLAITSLFFLHEATKPWKQTWSIPACLRERACLCCLHLPRQTYCPPAKHWFSFPSLSSPLPSYPGTSQALQKPSFSQARAQVKARPATWKSPWNPRASPCLLCRWWWGLLNHNKPHNSHVISKWNSN